jgi:hypothetical protein
MWQGGNQWSAWDSYLSFFRHVAKLKLAEYDKWQHWEAASLHGGPRLMHPEFCIVSDRPEVLRVDEQNRPHCADGPFCRWRDGSALYSFHGIRVPQYVIERPDLITVQKIESETNSEVRRVMVEKYGQARYLQDSNAHEIHRDEFGILYRKDIPDDEPLVMIHVLNSTPEPSGTLSRDEAIAIFGPSIHVAIAGESDTQMVSISDVDRDLRFKDYFLRVPPTMQRTRQAVAWTFGKEEQDYAPAIET